MINLNASIIIFYKRDSDDREINLKILLDFYKKHYENYEIIIMTDTVTHFQLINLENYSNVEVFVVDSDLPHNWNKMKAYNRGVPNTMYENLIFNDVDVIFDPACLKESLELLSKDNEKVILPNDGHCICVKESGRDKFKQLLDYEYLYKLIDHNNYNQLNFENDNILIGSLSAPGGGFIMKKRVVYNCNGFNPNFEGWGFEDDETLLRFNKMGYTVCRLVGVKPMFHMNHSNAIRETNVNYKTNENIYKFVSKLDSKLLHLYSNTWRM